MGVFDRVMRCSPLRKPGCLGRTRATGRGRPPSRAKVSKPSARPSCVRARLVSSRLAGLCSRLCLVSCVCVDSVTFGRGFKLSWCHLLGEIFQARRKCRLFFLFPFFWTSSGERNRIGVVFPVESEEKMVGLSVRFMESFARSNLPDLEKKRVFFWLTPVGSV